MQDTDLFPGLRVEVAVSPRPELREQYVGMKGTVLQKLKTVYPTWEVRLDSGEVGSFWPQDLAELSLLERIAEAAE